MSQQSLELLNSRGAVRELFRIPYVESGLADLRPTRYFGDLVFTDRAVCFLLRAKSRKLSAFGAVALVWYFLLTPLISAVAYALGATGLAGGAIGGGLAAAILVPVCTKLRLARETKFDQTVAHLVREGREARLDELLTFFWRENVVDLVVRGNRLVMQWSDHETIEYVTHAPTDLGQFHEQVTAYAKQHDTVVYAVRDPHALKELPGDLPAANEAPDSDSPSDVGALGVDQKLPAPATLLQALANQEPIPESPVGGLENEQYAAAFAKVLVVADRELAQSAIAHCDQLPTALRRHTIEYLHSQSTSYRNQAVTLGLVLSAILAAIVCPSWSYWDEITRHLENLWFPALIGGGIFFALMSAFVNAIRKNKKCRSLVRSAKCPGQSQTPGRRHVSP